MSFSNEHLTQLKSFIELCQENPDILHTSELEFFKNYLTGLGAKIPAKFEPKPTPTEPKEDVPEKEEVRAEGEKIETPEKEEKSDEIIESDVEYDMEGVIEPDDDPLLPTGEENKEPTDEEVELCDKKRSEAMIAITENEYEKALNLFNEAIVLNPGSAALYAKRASCLLKMNKPNASIRDCNVAIQFNPDNAQAYKFRGRAHRLLGHWEDAVNDLATACKIDYDDQANEWLKEVQPNAKKLQDHRRKYERLFEEKRIKDQQERIRKMREEREQAAKEATQNQGGGAAGPGFPGMGGIPGMGGMPDLSAIFNDPDIMQAFQDPEVAAAFQDLSTNPANFRKYESNPKVSNLMSKMAEKMRSGGMGAGGRFPGGFPGFTP